MSTEKLLAKVARSERFQVKLGPIYRYHGKNIDLRTVDTATTEALANDPGCMFIQWRDPKRRPKFQRAPFYAEETSTPPVPQPKKG